MYMQRILMISSLVLVGTSFPVNAVGLKHKHHGSLPTQVAKPEEKKELEKHKVADSCSRNPQSCSGGKDAESIASEDPKLHKSEPELIQVPQG
jgi:hypothetical protein